MQLLKEGDIVKYLHTLSIGIVHLAISTNPELGPAEWLEANIKLEINI